MSNQATIVDTDDRVIGIKDRSQLAAGDIVRITGLWIENSKGEVLIAQRSLTKQSNPGRWGPAAAGTVEPKESYESNIIKEAAEEIGITNLTLTPIIKEFNWGEDGLGRFCMWFKAKYDAPVEDFVLQEDEVASVAWIDKQVLYEDVRANVNKYVQSAKNWYRLFPL